MLPAFYKYATPNSQKDDPLKRIQEEINEVARRERELRQKDSVDDPTAHLDNMSGISDDSGISSASSPVNGMSSNVSSVSNTAQTHISGSELSAVAANVVAAAVAAAPVKPVAPVPYKRSITVGAGGHHQSTHMAASPASHHMTTVGPTLTRATSTPQIFTPTAKRFSVAGGSQKGMMQRFLASRGKCAGAGAAGGGGLGGRGGKDSILVSCV